MKVRAFSVWVLVLYVLFESLSWARDEVQSSFKLIDKQDDTWVLEFTSVPPQITSIEIDGKPHLLFLKESDLTQIHEKEGTPQLPSEAISIGIPFHTFIEAELTDLVFESVEDQLVAPVPAYEFTDEQEAIPVYRKDRVSYLQNQFIPSDQIVVDPVFTLRQQRIATVRIRPYQYNPATRTLRRIVNATLRIKHRSTAIDGEPLHPETPASPDPHFEEVYKSLLLNYHEAKRWRSGQAARAVTDPTRSWFETGRKYYKILINSDGWYKITRSDLTAAGAILSQIDLTSLKVFSRGVEVPIVVRPDTTVEFFGYRNHGDSTYIDFFTDTSAYWLTWGGTAGARFTSAVALADSPSAVVSSFSASKHFEQNTAYYQGTTQSEIIDNETIPGEGWVWNFFFPNTSITYPFSLEQVDQSGAATLRVRMFSTTLNYTNPDHRARFWINDSLAGEVTFIGRTGVTFTTSIPSTWLREGANTFRMQSIPTPSSPNQFYLDWFEIDYQRFLVAQNNQLAFNVTGAPGGSVFRFSVSGFTVPQIDVFDLTTRRKIGGVSVNGDSVAGYSITFKDSVSGPRSYVAVAGPGPRVVPPLTEKVFKDIRVNPGGADYIIITHKNFFAAAEQLASHRRALNGVRTTVVDVQDIYDEFNYGIFNGTKIKSFLQYAFQNWSAPAPAYLLLFGDASWDYYRYLPTTTKTNYIPAYGLPAGDNWYGTFNPDTSFLPSLLIGRIPVQDPVQAQRIVLKLIGYDNYSLGEWNKNFLFITGGNNLNEQLTFNSLSDNTINTYVSAPPVGGTPFRVYKATVGVIDGENKQHMKNLVRDGLTFVNFLGHSGGRIWGVDIGNPSDLENMNGMLPFVASVSCNVAAFAEPSNNVLSEDFVLADNRGAIAMWASSSLGYAFFGAALVNHFFSAMQQDSVRSFGALTTIARYKLWQFTGSGAITIAMVKLNPLIGDPLSRWAIPLKPDLALSANDIKLNTPTPSPNDSSFTVQLNIRNYGLVPPDSVTISLADVYNGQTNFILGNKKLGPTRHRDSLVVGWNATNAVGRHVLIGSIDPMNHIEEVDKLNNVASSEQYVYANLLSVVKPLNNMVVPSGAQKLVVTSPLGRDSVGFRYFFELDTVDTFGSPALVSSGPVVPGPVSGEWTTPVLNAGTTYFWRARTVEGSLVGNWVVSAFSTSSDVPPLPIVRRRESTAKQFLRDKLVQAAVTDSGVTIAQNLPVQLFCRSVGNRANANLDFYSIIRINDQVITGHWWEVGSSFMAIRLNEFTGAFEFRAFNVAGQAAQADSMRRFINNTPVGDYVAIVVVFNGRTNVSESLYVAIESLGSTLIRQVQVGQSWSLIGRKGNGGPGMTALESLTNDTAVVSFQVPNFYSFGRGSITSTSISIPTSWESLHWSHGGVPGLTDIRVALLGVQAAGSVDTIRVLPQDSTDVSLAFLNTLTSGPRYQAVRTAAILSSGDARFTPVLKDWWIDMRAPADLAVSARTIGVSTYIGRGSSFSLPVMIYNIGYETSDSSRVSVSVYDKQNKARLIASATVSSIAVGESRAIEIPISTHNLSRRVTLQVEVSPAKKSKDLVAENNVAYYVLEVPGGTQDAAVHVFADGVRLMDGDYVSTQPRIVARLMSEDAHSASRVELFINNKLVETVTVHGRSGSKSARSASGADPTFSPMLPAGQHEMKFRIAGMNAFGEVDTSEHQILVNVLDESRILQLYNHPNPFARDTYFTFVLTGSVPPSELVIRIFTIAGRKIRELVVPLSSLRIGFNRIYWDGRDNDGDELANGYYLYQVSTKGEGKSISLIEKLAKIR